MTRRRRATLAGGLLLGLVLLACLVWMSVQRDPNASQNIRDTSATAKVDTPRTSTQRIAATVDSIHGVDTATATQAVRQSVDTIQPVPGMPYDTLMFVRTHPLVIPVPGVKPSQLHDTFDDARAAGRTHNAIDIPVPHNTPVLAAAQGKILKLFQSKLGGTTLYQLDPDGHTVYYYAHLDHYADGMTEGKEVRQGEVVAYAGDTGDAGPGNYHLHFAITIVPDSKHYWGGTDVNPYPLLIRARAS